MGVLKGPGYRKSTHDVLKRLLGLKRSTSNDMVYCETGRLPLIVQRRFNMLKYWLKLQKSDNSVLKGLYENLLRAQSDNNVSNWLSEVRKILISIGMNDVWQQKMKKCSFLSPNKVLRIWHIRKLTFILTIQTSV